MGYETQLIVGSSRDNFKNDDGGIYFQVYATIDMCKLGAGAIRKLQSVNKTPEEKHWYFYSPMGDGNTMVTEDRYGAKQRPVDINLVIDALESDIKTDDYYRRLYWAVALLKSMRDDACGDELSVLLWGH